MRLISGSLVRFITSSLLVVSRSTPITVQICWFSSRRYTNNAKKHLKSSVVTRGRVGSSICTRSHIWRHMSGSGSSSKRM
jgi:hypothetical protein